MKNTLPRDIVFLSGKRTPFGTFGGSLKDQSATDLAVHASKAALAQADVRPDEVDHVVFGNVCQTSADAIYLARHVGLRCEVPIERPAYVVQRLCGSGFQSIVNAAQEILTGRGNVILAGGTESMSQAPHVIRGARWGIPLGKGDLEDTLWSALTDSYCNLPMAITAENLAEKYEIDQDTVDAYSIRSQQTWAAAKEAGRFDDEIAPMEVRGKKRGETVTFDTDEHPRPQTTLESLKKLPKVFKKDGVIHAGAASGICDGAGAMVVADGEWASQNGKKPIARLLGWHVAGVDPSIMGFGPVPAIEGLLKQTETAIGDWDLVEINEAFAPQYLACEKALGLDREKANVDGGAIALGHPLGASGTRITMHVLYALKARGKRFGIGSACIGGGQGIAVALEIL
jgi:acetyl-CoA acyltransferase 2